MKHALCPGSIAPSLTRSGFLQQASAVCGMVALTSLFFSQATAAAQGPGINNAALIPKVVPDSAVKIEGMSPDWVKTLIMAQLRIETATPEGTFAAATRALDHYAETGVNGLWINPIYERGSKGNGYGNFGPHTIEPLLTGTSDLPGSFQAVKHFVDEAHRRNIRVIFDIVVWGTTANSPLVAAHPEIYLKANGQFAGAWGGYAFDWNSKDLKAWFTKAAVEFIEKTGADGFRVDLAPDISDHYFKEIREALHARGRKIIVVSEMNSQRSGTFDFEQVSVHGWTEEGNLVTPGKWAEQQRRFGKHNDYLFHSNLVETIQTGAGIGKASPQQEGRSGMERFYTSNLLHHDDRVPFVAGNRVRMAYSSILAPFIPMWWIGEEWDNPKVPLPDSDGAMYFNTIDWSLLERPANRAFFEDTKQYIRIRRTFPEIFEHFPENAREANIAKLDTRSNGVPNKLQAYARFGGGKAVLVVPNYGSVERTQFMVTPDFATLHLGSVTAYQATDLMTGKVIASGSAADLKSFPVEIEGEYLGIYLVEAK